MITVAIVEDIAEIREGLTTMIQESDVLRCMHAFSNAEDALSMLIEFPVDVVLMDIQLPAMSGIECMRQLKLQQPQMQFIICTIFQDDDNIFTALKTGASGYLLKGDDPNAIILAITEVHGGGAPMNAQIARRVIESFQQVHLETKTEEQQLTSREKELLSLLAKGLRYKEIADKLFISIETVRKHINNIYSKLQVQSRMEAVNKFFGERSIF